MRRLAAEGRTVLFVTHKLHEVMAITDRVTVLRDGRVVGEPADGRDQPARNRARDDRAQRQSEGREAAARAGAPLLEAVDFTVASPAAGRSSTASRLCVRAGEIVGARRRRRQRPERTGRGAGGLARPDGGEVAHLRASSERGERRRRIAAAGLAYIPEDRAAVGSALAGERRRQSRDGLSARRRRSRAAVCIEPRGDGRAGARTDRDGSAIQIASERAPVGTLSGGNLQKVVVARELAHDAPVLIAEQPTRGVDVGATEFIHERLVAERDSGRAVLLVSAELSEILALSRSRARDVRGTHSRRSVPGGGRRARALGLLMAGRTRRRVSARARRTALARACGRRRSRLAIVFAASSAARWCSSPAPIRCKPMPRLSVARSAPGQSPQHAELGDAAGRHDARRGDPAARRHDQSRRRRAAGHRRPRRRRCCRFILPRPGPLALGRRAGRRGARRGTLRRARRLGRDAPRRPDADLEPAAELPGGRRDLLSRALSPS